MYKGREAAQEFSCSELIPGLGATWRGRYKHSEMFASTPCPVHCHMVRRGWVWGRFSAPCNKYCNPHVLRNEDSAHFLASFRYWLKPWPVKTDRLLDPSEGCPPSFTAFSSASQPTLTRPSERRCLRGRLPRKYPENNNLLIFCCCPQCACVLSSLAFPLWIVDPGLITALAVQTQRHSVSAQSWSDGRKLARAVKPWESIHYDALSSRNNLSGQLIGRSVLLSVVWCTHCWDMRNTPNWHFL